MDNYSSGEDLVIKTRKPYTITKQRERWTEEEHNRFLEALKLYGRAWQKIEEHIGTKTAVQIRSHAQKFFTKLEKEAVNKGVPIGQTHDIEIPPPRPKRKPSNPYPRKTSVGSPSQAGGKEGKQSVVGSPLRQEKLILDLEKEPLPEISEGSGTLENIYEGANNNSEVSNLLQAAQSAQHPSLPLPNEHTLNSAKSRNLCTFAEFMPSLRESINKDEECKSILTAGECKEHQTLESNKRPSSDDNVNGKMFEFINEKRADEGDHSENLGSFPSNEVQSTQNYPRQVPVHILDGSLGVSAGNIASEITHQESIHHQTSGHCENLGISENPTSSAAEHQSSAPKSSIHQSFQNLLPILPPIQSQNEYRAYAHVSSTFASLIASALLQNPAAHAAASFAATFWPCATVEASGDENSMGEGCPSQHMRAAPSIAAIAGATVAAATAWWAANGLLPFCAPFNAAFSCSPTSTSTIPMDTGQTRAVKSDKGEGIHDAVFQDQQVDPECSEALQEQHSVLKSSSVSTSNSDEHEDAKENPGISAQRVQGTETVTHLNDSNDLKSRKQVDRSSCGSNTPSSSEVETDALEKHEKDKEEQPEFDINHQSNDSNIRRGRIFSNINDPWKEVSEEGRMAFQALFSRDVLPQSFYSCQDLKNKGNNITADTQPTRDDDARLQSNGHHMYNGCSNNRLVEDFPRLLDDNKMQEGLPTFGIGHANLKTRRTGFKPYKRCSIEAKDGRIANCSNRDDEKCPKRLRVDGEEAST